MRRRREYDTVRLSQIRAGRFRADTLVKMSKRVHHGEVGLTYLTEEGEPEPDDTLVMILNASHVGVEVTPPERVKGCWNIEINTAARDGSGCHLRSGRTLSRNAGARSLVLLRGSTPAT